MCSYILHYGRDAGTLSCLMLSVLSVAVVNTIVAVSIVIRWRTL